MQRKKNIRLLVVLSVLLAVLTVLSFTGTKTDRLDVPRNLFIVENTQAINNIKLTSDDFENQLAYNQADWQVNNKYRADLQRVTVLFSILKQVNVRRKVSKSQETRIDSLFQNGGIKAAFFAGDQLVKSFSVAGDEDRQLTYFKDENGTFIVQIPGYRVYIANIFKLDEYGWRNPFVFDLEWINLKDVDMIYPAKQNEEFLVDFSERRYEIEGIERLDTARVTNFLDDVSRLYVNDFLYADELKQYQRNLANTQATVVVKDVGDNYYTVEFFEKVDDQQIIARIDSSEYALLNYNKVRKILRPKSFFRVNESDQ